ncbi:MAG: glyoxalase [Piscirickettsiaceae bacterium]|jgi:glyoxylase I family protein|nr:glyoxalase [Piscirickettsiaceae bacterium]
MIKSIAHTSFLVADVKQSLVFYCDVLQMHLNETRPDFAFDGAWIDISDSGQQIHLMQLPNPDSVEGRPEHGGRDKHVALVVEDIAKLEQRLINADVMFTKSKSGRAAFFCRDPDGNALEFAEDFTPKL